MTDDDEPARPGGETLDAELLWEMIGFAAEQLTELEFGGLTGAAWGEKCPERLVHRSTCSPTAVPAGNQ